MRLKSLEIKGFKSFADKTIVNFDEGITGIIGPNGCGKSNIIDSIRWVIGEQKISALRSENLEALVFNGSRTRSASGLAEVSLTFENTKNLLPTEFSTVTITRKFYKNGESEYRLNDVSCRMKDIHNLFMDTGVSTDSYAIIELGMVDDIIRDKENSRRRMLEQAAGITIYKTRKKEAKAKLDATEQDLNRIEDLLFEINNQLKSLENQAKKAEKYYEIKKDYKEISVELAKASLEGFNDQYRDLNDQAETETDKKIRLEAEIATEEAAIEQEKVGFIEKERALQSMQHEFNDLVQKLRTHENEKNLAAQKLQYLKEKESSIKQFLDKAEGQLTGIEESIEFSSLQLTEEEGKTGTLHQQLEEVKMDVASRRQVFDEKRTAVDELRKQFQHIQRQQFDAEKKVAVADASILNLQRALAQLQDERQQRESQLKQLEEQRIDKEQELEDKRAELLDLQEQHERTRQQIFETQQALEVLRNKLAEENRKLDSKRNEYALLKSLIDSMEGYPESVKFLHNNSKWNHTAPILSDIIYVKEEYRAAVENVLEPYLNYYVVNDLEEGLQAIHLLDANQKGKANFFMLDRVNNYKRNEEHQPNETIKALDVIEVDEKHRQLAEYLLSNVFIADSETALADSNGCVVLEKHGKFVKGKYTIGGGSVGLFEGKKIGRAKNLEKLKQQIETQDAVVLSLKAEIQSKHNQVITYNEQLKENAIKQTQNEINNLTNQVFALQNKIENLNATQASSLKRLEDHEANLENNQEAIADVREELLRLNDEMKLANEQMSTQEQDYRMAEQDYNEINRQFNESNLQLTRQQSKISALKTELQFKRNQLNDLTQQIETNKVQLKQSTESIIENEDLLKEFETFFLNLMRMKEEEEKKLNEADQAYYNLRNALNAKESELRHKVKSKDILDHLLTEVKDKLNELKLQLAGMKERLSVEFRINLDEIIDQPRSTETPVEDLQAASDRMKKRLENMGEVNPTAIEAYQEMKKRYDF
ncbi:MAG: chromosome partition protein smc, partial [Segetibacter sp.]|nr:chromosome partition protein smc [Segetibacter sp.]